MIEEIREHLLLILLYLLPTPQTKQNKTKTHYSTMDFCESVVQNPYLDPQSVMMLYETCLDERG